MESAIATYELKAGQKLSRKRIWLYGAACVIDAIANRRGFAPDEKADGRTLEEDLLRCLSKISRAEMQ
jgi:hypothetical protein